MASFEFLSRGIWRGRGKPLGGWFCLWAICAMAALAADPPEDEEPMDVEQVYRVTRARHQLEPQNATSAWHYGRACFDLAETAITEHRRELVAQEGIGACQRAVELKPGLAAGHYYLALNHGQYARVKRLAALKSVKAMEESLLRAAALDPAFDYAGPHRSLGILYLEAPGWPISVGDEGKARKHLEKAVELAPDYPSNRFELLEACIKWRDKAGMQRQRQKLEKLMPEVRANFPEPHWKETIRNWEERWKQLKK